MESLLGQSGFGRHNDILYLLFTKLAVVDLKTVKRDGASKTLLVELDDYRKVRNCIIHSGESATREVSKLGEALASSVFKLMVLPMLTNLGLMVAKDGTIIRRSAEPNPLIDGFLCKD